VREFRAAAESAEATVLFLDDHDSLSAAAGDRGAHGAATDVSSIGNKSGGVSVGGEDANPEGFVPPRTRSGKIKWLDMTEEDRSRTALLLLKEAPVVLDGRTFNQVNLREIGFHALVSAMKRYGLWEKVAAYFNGETVQKVSPKVICYYPMEMIGEGVETVAAGILKNCL